MSAASLVQTNQNRKTVIQPDTLLENLYTHYGLAQLQNMLEESADEAMLVAWDVSESTYFAEVRAAIELIEQE